MRATAPTEWVHSRMQGGKSDRGTITHERVALARSARTVTRALSEASGDKRAIVTRHYSREIP